DVYDARQHERAFVNADGVETDLDRHFSAVLAKAVEVAPRAHRAAGRMPEEACAQVGVSAPVTLRYQILHGLPQQLGPVIAEEALGLCVRRCPAAPFVPYHHRVGGGFVL